MRTAVRPPAFNASPCGQEPASALGTGVGTGVFIAPNNSALLGAAPPERRGVASGVLAEARNVGMVVGVGIAGAVMSTVLARAPGPAPRCSPTRPERASWSRR